MTTHNITVLCSLESEESFFQPDTESAGYDLRSGSDYTILPYSRCSIETTLRMAMPPGIAARVISRSGLSFKHGLEVGAGLIDPSYRGFIRVNLYNHSDEPFSINRGDRFAQIVFFQYFKPSFLYTNLPESARDRDGFGSSGT